MTSTEVRAFPVGAPIRFADSPGGTQYTMTDERCNDGTCIIAKNSETGRTRHIGIDLMELSIATGDVVLHEGTERHVLCITSRGTPSAAFLLWDDERCNSIYRPVDAWRELTWVRREPMPCVGDRAQLVHASGAGHRRDPGVITQISDTDLATIRWDDGREQSYHLGRFAKLDAEPEPVATQTPGAWPLLVASVEPPVSLSELGSRERNELPVTLSMDEMREVNRVQMERINSLTAERADRERRVAVLERQVAAQATKWDQMAIFLAREAEDRGWCSEYDSIVERWGLPTRDDLREDIGYTVRVQIEVPVDSEMVRTGLGVSGDIEMEADDTTVTVTLIGTSSHESLGQCVCGSADYYQLASDIAQSAGMDDYRRLDISVSCDADGCVHS